MDLADSVTNNNQWTAAMEYDLVGNLIKTTDAENKQITNSYDKAGRVKVRSYSNLDTPSVYYYYDGMGLSTPPPATNNFAKGKLTKVSSSISATQFTSFDNFGRTLASQQITDGNTYESKYKFDFGGRLVEQTYPSGKVVRNFFESDGDLNKIVRQGKVYASDFSYTSTGVIEKLKLGNGLWESAKLNERQQVEEIKLGTSPTDGSKWQVNYKYGEIQADGSVNAAKNTGNIAKQTINFAGLANPFVQTYKYDALDRIVEAKEVSGANQTWKQTFNYDRFGNRNQFSQVVGTTALAINSQTLPSVDANTNRFNSGQNFQYDKSGNIIQDAVNGQVRNFIFNGDNKQVHVKNAANENIGTYYYDGNGSRVKKVTASETTIFAYDGGGKLVAEYSTTPPPTTPTVSYTATDTLGSPRVITDKTGNVISRRDFMPFGEELNANTATFRLEVAKYNYGNDGIRKRFTGYEKDQETGLDFAQARYYNNQHGRFTAVDPLLASGKSSNPQTFNRYVYVMNRPLKYTDKSGLQAGKEIDDAVVYTYRYALNWVSAGTFIANHPKEAMAIGSVEKWGTNISTIAARFPIQVRTTDKFAGLNEHRGVGVMQNKGSDINAFRHVLWQAIITSNFGQDLAKEAGDSHEETPNKSLNIATFTQSEVGWNNADETVDLLNNQIGRQIGLENKTLDNKDLALKVLDFYRKSGLNLIFSENGDLIVRNSTITKEQYDNARRVILTLNNLGFTTEEMAEYEKRAKAAEEERKRNQKRLPAKHQE